jgi:hypothetical protein
MLAPANYGSKLASMGQSLIGRVLKGWDNWFHTGKEMLSAPAPGIHCLYLSIEQLAIVPHLIGSNHSEIADRKGLMQGLDQDLALTSPVLKTADKIVSSARGRRSSRTRSTGSFSGGDDRQ